MPNIITGLDIGSAYIKGVVAEEKKNGNLAVLSAFKSPSAGMRRGVIVDVDDFIVAIRDVIADLQRISKEAARNIFINVNGPEIRSRNSRGVAAVARADQEIQQDDLDRVIQASRAIKLQPNYMILHNVIREYFVDDVGDIQNPIGMTGNRLEAVTLIIEAFTPQVEALFKSIRRVGGEVGGLIFSPLTSARAVLSKKQKELGTLMIDFGFGTTSFVVYEENKIMYAKSLPIGSGYLTNDIAIGLKTSIDIAEKLKHAYGFALAREVSRKAVIRLAEFDPTNVNEISQRFLAEIIEVRLAELLELINNELKSLGRAAQLPAGVVITGGGVKLPGLAELVKQELKLAVQIGYPNIDAFEVSTPAYKEMLDDPEFAGAVGLVLWGGDETKKPVRGFGGLKNFLRNFIP
jgi:cell division protein FtsA